MTENENAIESLLQAKGKNAPRLTPDMVSTNIADIEILKHVTKSGQVLRWAILTTLSGYAVVGRPSASISPENDDQEAGEQVARENSRNELWPLMGFALKERLHFFPESLVPQIMTASTSTLPAHQQRVVTERDELADKISKLAAFLVTPTFQRLDDAEQTRLSNQVDVMRLYCTILEQRIESFPK
jgi:hypothetical protein